MLFTSDKVDGIETERMGLILKTVPENQLDREVETLAQRVATVPITQFAMQKMMINQAESSGLNFKKRVEQVGWKQAVEKRDQGKFDLTKDKPLD